MSLSLGQSEGYINKIESQQMLPSMTGFFYICGYFEITPKEFFDDSICLSCRCSSADERFVSVK